jgi:hypothetical protein
LVKLFCKPNYGFFNAEFFGGKLEEYVFKLNTEVLRLVVIISSINPSGYKHWHKAMSKLLSNARLNSDTLTFTLFDKSAENKLGPTQTQFELMLGQSLVM